MPDVLLPPITEPAPQWELRLRLEDLAETEELAARLAVQLRAGDLLVLSGGLGAGKTTFTQALAEGLGVEGMVSSPTFVLSRVHHSTRGGADLVHVDAYRTDEDGFESMDLVATLSEAVTVVEWGRGTAEAALVGTEGSWLDLELARTEDSRSTAGQVPAVGPSSLSLTPGTAGNTQAPAEIITDFSETEEELLGSVRTAVLRAYGPRWADVRI